VYGNKLVVVAGSMRTGTSMLMQCLHENGFYLGEKIQLRGGYFLGEHLEFSRYNDLIKSGKDCGEEFINVLHKDKIQALKSHAPTVKYWLKFKEFQDAKYLITKRDEWCVIQSLLVKKKAESIDACRDLYHSFVDELSALKDYDHIFVEYENMLKDSETEGKKIAKFLELEKFTTDSVNDKFWTFRPYEINQP